MLFWSIPRVEAARESARRSPVPSGHGRADARASAIAAAARRMFETIGVWDGVAARAEPILDMVITDSKLDDAVRPVFLTFAGEVQPGEPFAHMVENGDIIAALTAKAKAEGVVLLVDAVASFAADASRATVRLGDGDFHAELEKRFGLQLGDIAVAGPRRAFPLGFSVARAFIADRVALVG